MNLARTSAKSTRPNLHGDPLLTRPGVAARACARLRVEPAGETARRLGRRGARRGRSRGRRSATRAAPPRRPAGAEHGRVGRDEQHPLARRGARPRAARAACRRGREAHRERAALGVVADAVEDDHAARAASSRRSSRARRRARARPRTALRAAGCSRRRGRASRQPRRWRRRLVQEHRRGDADVQRLDRAGERDRDERVAGAADERPQPLALGAEDERDAAARGRSSHIDGVRSSPAAP